MNSETCILLWTTQNSAATSGAWTYLDVYEANNVLPSSPLKILANGYTPLLIDSCSRIWFIGTWLGFHSDRPKLKYRPEFWQRSGSALERWVLNQHLERKHGQQTSWWERWRTEWRCTRQSRTVHCYHLRHQLWPPQTDCQTTPDCQHL